MVNNSLVVIRCSYQFVVLRLITGANKMKLANEKGLPLKEVKILINVENDAFYPAVNDEVARILIKLAKKIEQREIDYYESIKDINGNPVGKIEFY